MTTRTPCQELADDALGLVALPVDAPERVRAEEHARTCPACASALGEARRLLVLLDAALPAPPPSPAALARASAPVLAELDARAGARVGAGRLAGAVAAAVLAAWALPLALARNPVASGGPFALSLGLAVLAAAASVATVRWGGRVAAAFPALSVLTALLVGGAGGTLDTVGLHCAGVEVMTAAGVGAFAWLVARGLAARGFALPSAKGSIGVAAVGGGALAGHAALHLACPGAYELPHVLVFHSGPVALAVGLALLLARATAARGGPVRSPSA